MLPPLLLQSLEERAIILLLPLIIGVRLILPELRDVLKERGARLLRLLR